ncbi:MAG: acyl-CoA dehydrogenase family protein [Thermodesulfobacteriota bacterium]
MEDPSTGRRLLESRLAAFAADKIASRPALSRQREFPADLWREMAALGLFGAGLPQRFGGYGEAAPALSAGARRIVENGGNLGMGLSWLIHEMTGRYLIRRFGTAEQQQAFLPAIAAGTSTVCLAVSEPDAGAHPKYLNTTAVKDGNDYRLSGTKTYLTNGPIADVFIVIAITEIQGRQHQYSAFLVTRDAPGLTVDAPMALSFLRPAPHGTIRLDNCPAEASQVLGPAGFAYDTMVRPFRVLEEALMMGVLAGGLGFAITRLGAVAKNISEPRQNRLFDCYLALCGLQAAAEKAALSVEAEDASDDQIDLGLYFRKTADDLATGLHQLNRESDPPEPQVEQMIADLSGALTIGASAMQTRKRKRLDEWLK